MIGHAAKLLACGALLLTAALVFALGARGWASPLVSGSDVELSYEGEGPPRTPAFGPELRASIQRRLAAKGVSADVSEDHGRLSVTVAARDADLADELATWTGTLLVAQQDPELVLAPPGTPGLVERATTSPQGRVDHYWEGSRSDVMQAIATWTVDRDHRIVAEAMWGSDTAREAPRWRTRVVRLPAITELKDGVLLGASAGNTIALVAAPGSNAADALARMPAGRGDALMIRGRTSLGHPTRDGDVVTLSFGAGLASYGRAQEEKRLLMTPRLPKLHQVERRTIPRSKALQLACLAVPLLLSIAWLTLVRRFDRAHPEPLWLVSVTFLMGVVMTVPAGLVALGLTRLSPLLDPRIVTFGGAPLAFPLAALVSTLVVGLPEEAAKLLGSVYASRRPEFDEPVDGMVYAMVSSLGFAAAENVGYFTQTRMAAPIVLARAFMSIPAHLFFGAIWGYALGARLVTPTVRLGRYVLLAACAHGTFDALLATTGGASLAVVANVGLAGAFVVLVRRSLRHGIVTEASRGATTRTLIRVGSASRFVFTAVAFQAIALGLFALGASYQLARQRPEPSFVIGSSLLLCLLGLVASRLPTTLPLDVAIDDHGVTFAGAARAWACIRGHRTSGDTIELDCEPGPLRLGPASEAQRARLVEALRARGVRELGASS